MRGSMLVHVRPQTRCIAVSLLLAVGLAHATLSIVVPELLDIEFYEELMDSGKQRGNRSLMINDVISNYDLRQDMSRSLPCISTFLDDYLQFPERIALMVPDTLEDMSGVGEYFIRNIRRDTVVFAVDNHLQLITGHNTSGNAVILIDKPTDLSNVSYSFFRLCASDCFFAVILTHLFEDERSFLEESDELVKLMWTHSVGKVVMLGTVKDSVVMAGSVSYKDNDTCGPSSAVLIDRCVKDEWQRERILKPWPLNKCIVKVAFFKNPPYTVESNETEGRRYGGIECMLIQEVLYSMNGNLHLEEIEWTNGTDTYQEIGKRLDYEEGFDIVFGGILWSPSLAVDYTVSYELVRIVWLVPVLSNVSLQGLIGAFKVFVWIAIVVVFFLGGLVRIFLIKDITCLNMVGLVIGVSASRQPKRLSTRMKFISWALFGFFLCQFYLVKLADVLMSQANFEVNTVKELIASKFRLCGTARFANFFDVSDEDVDDEEEEAIQSIRNRFIVLNQDAYVRRLADLEAGRDTTWALLAMLNISTSKPGNSESHFHMMEDSMGSYPLAMAVWRGLPYLAEIDYKIQVLKQAGLVEYWAEKYMLQGNYFSHEEDDDDSENDNLAIEELAPGFLLLIIGYIVAFLTFVAEVAFYPSKWLE